jgi:hypothetical protein
VDLARFVAFELAAWPARDEADAGPLRRSSVRESQELGHVDELRERTGSYPRPMGSGLGWSVFANCDLEHVVWKDGLSEGYVADIHFMPQRGIGVILLANLWDTSFAGLGYEALRIVSAPTGERSRPPSPAVTAAAGEIMALVAAWSEPRFADLFTPEFSEELPADVLRRQLDGLHAQQGACRAPATIEGTSLRSGRFRADCDRGQIEVEITLSPGDPKRVARFVWHTYAGPDAALTQAAARVASLVGRWDDDLYAALFSPTVDRGSARARLAGAASEHRACRVDRVLYADGPHRATFRLACDVGALDVELEVASPGSRVTDLRLRPPHASRRHCP